MIDKIFLHHPRSVGESYLQHQSVAFSFAADLLLASLACAVHAVVPALFPRTASRAIERLQSKLARHRRGPDADASAEPRTA